MQKEEHPTQALYWIIALNTMPVLGVLFFNWHIFELIVLYWAENVVIGVITFLKFIVRPYEHRIELVLPLFFAPFFLVHYGGFTAAHGVFVFAMFGEDWAASTGLQEHRLAWELLVNRGLVFALLGLMLLHAQEWRRDIQKRGLGADAVFALMTAPYRRIIVLHLTIIGSGFLFMELGEPVAALLLLVALKTGFDVHQLRRDIRTTDSKGRKAQFITEAMMEKKFEINGEEYTFETYTEMAQSKHFQTAMNLLRIIMSREDLTFAENFIAEKITEEAGAVR